MSEIIPQVIKLVERYWHGFLGLFFAEVALVLVLLVLFQNISWPWELEVAVLVVGVCLTLFLWVKSNRIKKIPTGKIGIVVAINCESGEESQRVRSDFIFPLRELLLHGELGRFIEFVEPPSHCALNVIDPESASVVQRRYGSTFMIYGRVRNRVIDGKRSHVLDLNGIVSHRPVGEHDRKKLSSEFGELLPRRVTIQEENDLLSFQFTSEWADIVARYIIGIALALSGKLDWAEDMFAAVESQLKLKDRNFHVYRRIYERLPTRRAEIVLARANYCYQRWRETREAEYLTEGQGFITGVKKYEVAELSGITLLRSIFSFLINRDVEGSIAHLRKIKDKANEIWLLNMAFLNGYKGDLAAASRFYRRASAAGVTTATLGQIEEFIDSVLEQEPDKYQLHFCLAHFNWKIKGDLLSAEREFNFFLQKGNDTEFAKERNELVPIWIAGIQAEILSSVSE